MEMEDGENRFTPAPFFFESFESFESKGWSSCGLCCSLKAAGTMGSWCVGEEKLERLEELEEERRGRVKARGNAWEDVFVPRCFFESFELFELKALSS